MEIAMNAFLSVFMVFFAVPGERNGVAQGKAKPVDFVYVDADDPIEVPFGLGASCVGAGAYLDPFRAVAIQEVSLGGVKVEPLQAKGYVHDRKDLVLENPGPSFQYRIPLDRLSSFSSGDRRGEMSSSLVFPVGTAALPSLIEIIYKIRCADGRLSSLMMTRGKKLVIPTAPPASKPN